METLDKNSATKVNELLSQAEELWQSEKQDQAIKLVSDYLGNEHDVRVQCFLGEKLIERSRHSDAIEVLEKALEGLKKHPEKYQGLEQKLECTVTMLLGVATYKGSDNRLEAKTLLEKAL